MLAVEESKGPKQLSEMQTLTGEIEIQRKERAQTFCEELDPFAENYKRINDT